MKYFEHYDAASVEDAVTLLKKFNGRGKLIAGGTDLLGTLKADILPDYPEAVINIKTIPDLAYINVDENGVKIGALTKLAEIVQSRAIKESLPILAEAAESVASPEIRNMGTLAGNLCQDTRCWYYRYPHTMGGRIECYRKGRGSCPAVKGDNRYHSIFEGKKCFAAFPSDMAVALTALDAVAVAVGSEGRKAIPLAGFYETRGSILKPDEIVTEIQVPRTASPLLQSFLKFRLRKSVDFAIVSVACGIRLNGSVCIDARIVLGAVAPTPYRVPEAENALKGTTLSSSAVENAANSAVINAKPLSRNAYKVNITKALVKRAIHEAGKSIIQ